MCAYTCGIDPDENEVDNIVGRSEIQVQNTLVNSSPEYHVRIAPFQQFTLGYVRKSYIH